MSMINTQAMYDGLRAAGFDDPQARAIVEVAMMTRDAKLVLDTAKMYDILRAAGMEEKKARGLAEAQPEMRKWMNAQKAHA